MVRNDWEYMLKALSTYIFLFLLGMKNSALQFEEGKKGEKEKSILCLSDYIYFYEIIMIMVYKTP